MAIATNEQQVVDSVPNQLFIGGEWRDGAEGGTIPVEDPATEETIAEIADATVGDAFKALEAAVAAQAEFRRVPETEPDH